MTPGLPLEDHMPYFGIIRNAYEKRRRETLRALLLKMLGGKCVVCRTRKNLEFHHLDPKQKEYRIAMMLGWAQERAIAEAKKCELRCRKHHAEIHAVPIVHGTSSGWRRSCRCDACVTVYRQEHREYTSQYRANGRDKTRINYRACSPRAEALA
jgi:hypothetical protein